MLNAPYGDIEMPSSVALGNLESAVKQLVASGRYNSKSEVIREGIRLVEEREKKLAALDAALARGVADADTGRVAPADEVFDALRARYKGMAERQGV
jgi:antitoxin ParD1/3/4